MNSFDNLVNHIDKQHNLQTHNSNFKLKLFANWLFIYKKPNF